METFISILEGILFIAKVVFSITMIYFIAVCAVWASDEYKESRLERSLELARTSTIDNFFTPLVKEKREYEARHRFDKKKPQYRHVPDTSYLERVGQQTRNRVLPFGDEDFFAALLAEQREFAPSW